MTIRPANDDVSAPETAPVAGPARYAFGSVEVDVRRMAVTVRGEPVALEPKSFDVLRYLVEHRDRLVTKEDLLGAVWGDTFVTPNVLTRAIAQVRKAIGDDAQDAAYIETVSRRGYRFIAPVAALPAAEGPSSPPAAVEADARRGFPAARWLVAAAVAIAALAAAASWTIRGARDGAPAATRGSEGGFGAARRVTARSGLDGMPALSPDGRSIAFVSDRTGAFEIYVLSLAGGAREVAITADGGQNLQPAWSPDGAWIAFHSRARRGVWVVPSTGGAARQVAEFGSDPAWSRDGTLIAFTSDAGGMAGQSIIVTVRPDGTDRREVTRIGAPPGGHREPAWSWDGRTLVFTVSTGRWSQEFWTVVPGREPRRVAGSTLSGADPQFAPGDRALVWSAWGSAGTGAALWRQPLDEDGDPAGDPVEIGPAGGAVDGVSVGADGSIAYAAGASDTNLWTVDVGEGAAGAEPARLTSDVVRAATPAYSRDGRIAYVQSGPGRPTSTWIVREEGSTPELLLDEAPVSSPHWMSDGRLFVMRARPRPASIWLVDADTRRATFTGLSGRDVNNPRPSPDGREVAFHVIETDGTMNVWIQPIDGGPRRRVTSDAEAVSYPAWSPDGKWLAVEVKRGDETHVGVIAREGGPVEQITFERGQSWPHSWAPDGDRIAFAAERDGVWNVWTVSRRTRALTQLTRFASPAGYVRYPAWSPRGNRIVFERSIRQGGIWLLPAGR